ncbi:peptidase M15 [Aquimarina aggregata]|uniref:D-alanyl-D-alanine dipeptidase n=1 Tax=Aquimarina aggregata TaxID=1642818 RepID=A0A163D3A0_9FLAO|nr:M15 family metallopeptidase [Aquimarina aggregata]KZS42962.1 peptidase M15 [Aquimarina aggregata]
MVIRKLMALIFLMILVSCTTTEVAPESQTMALLEKAKALRLRGEKVEQSLYRKKDSIEGLSAGESVRRVQERSNFVNIAKISDDFVFDMKYATKDNFLKKQVYDCAKCLVRDEVAKALIAANNDLQKQGYRIKFFDCYRPHSVQKKMWKIFPNPGYVANPKGGSIHNKGAAVDITLVRSGGGAIDMGTKFDHFGKKAHHAYTKLSKEVLANRKLLRTTMEKHGFKTIKTEWWHYNFKSNQGYKISDFRWDCD